MILLTDEEKALAVDAEMERTKDRPDLMMSYSDIIQKALLKKVAKWLEELPTDGWDKWHWYHLDLAKALLKEVE